jgi:hypothetical protein
MKKNSRPKAATNTHKQYKRIPAYSNTFISSHNTARILIGAWPEEHCSHVLVVPPECNPHEMNYRAIRDLSIIATLEYSLSNPTIKSLAHLWRLHGATDIFINVQDRPKILALTNATQNAVNELHGAMSGVCHG